MNSANTPEEVPWYLRKAERPKIRRTYNVFQSHVDMIEMKLKDHASAFVRYLMDCYSHSRIPTDIGFKTWLQNKEKF